MKKRLTILGLLLMLLLPIQEGMAAGPQSIQRWGGEMDIQPLINRSDVVKIRNSDYKYGIFSNDGHELIPAIYKLLEETENGLENSFHGYFEVSNENGINNHALIDIKNRMLISYEYSDYITCSENWVIGITLETAIGKPYDYADGLMGTGPSKYRIKTADVFYIEDAAATKVASLNREQYQHAKAMDDYLLIGNRSNDAHLYDKTFAEIEVQHAFTSVFDASEFYLDARSHLVSRITGKDLGKKDYFFLRSLKHSDYMTAEKRGEQEGIIDCEGNEILDFSYDSIIAYGYDNCVSIKRAGKYGLFDLSAEKILLPCQYDDIPIRSDGYIANGYIRVVLNGKEAFVNTDNEITCLLETDSSWTPLGCTTYLVGPDYTQLIAADGTVTVLDHINEIYKHGCSPSGYYLVAKNKDDWWGVIDWHGNTVFDFTAGQSGYFEFINDDYLIYTDSYAKQYVYQLIK